MVEDLCVGAVTCLEVFAFAVLPQGALPACADQNTQGERARYSTNAIRRSLYGPLPPGQLEHRVLQTSLAQLPAILEVCTKLKSSYRL